MRESLARIAERRERHPPTAIHTFAHNCLRHAVRRSLRTRAHRRRVHALRLAHLVLRFCRVPFYTPARAWSRFALARTGRARCAPLRCACAVPAHSTRAQIILVFLSHVRVSCKITITGVRWEMRPPHALNSFSLVPNGFKASRRWREPLRGALRP